MYGYADSGAHEIIESMIFQIVFLLHKLRSVQIWDTILTQCYDDKW